jgi:hypothetical protein
MKTATPGKSKDSQNRNFRTNKLLAILSLATLTHQSLDQASGHDLR